MTLKSEKSRKFKDTRERSKDRGYLVIKRNDLIQKSRHRMDLQEQKVILFLISKVKPHDKNFTEQVFSISEFCEVCGLDNKSGGNYSCIKKTLQSIRDRSIWITLDDGSETTLAWINRVHIEKHSGIVQLKLDEMLKPYLLELQENFTQYELLNILTMQSQYSIRLYELLKSYEYRKIISFEIDELKHMLFAENYQLHNDFKKRVIDIAIREINALTDISVTYEFIKVGRKFSQISFTICHKYMLEKFKTGQETIQSIR